MLAQDQLQKQNPFKQIDDAFKSGEFEKTKNLLNQLPKTNKNISRQYYYLGLIENRKENYKNGIKLLKKSLKYSKGFKDIYYELGQAYYAENDLINAVKAFKFSQKNNIKPEVSLYYQAHIYQILEKYKLSQDYYLKLAQIDNADINIKQVAQFQLGEVYLSMVNPEEESVRDAVEEKVIPTMEQSILFAPNAQIVTEIRKRIEELKNQYKLDPNFMVNGRKSPDSQSYRFNQSLSYDNNVAYANELPTTVASLRDSFVFETGLNADYNYVMDYRYTLNFSLSFDYIEHSNDTNSEVFQNDTYSLTAATNFSFDFSLLNDPAVIQVGYAHAYSARDYEGIHEKKTSGNNPVMSASMQFKLFNFGNTNLNYSSSTLYAYDPSLNSDKTAYGLSQNFSLSPFNLIIFNYLRSSTIVEETSYNTDSNYFRIDYLMIEKIPSINIQYGVSANLQELVNDADRGTEVTLTASVKGTKKINNNLRYSVSYEYTDKSSENSDYTYDKEAVTFELRLNY